LKHEFRQGHGFTENIPCIHQRQYIVGKGLLSSSQLAE